MTQSFESQIRSYKLWTWLYGQLQKNEQVNQSDIIDYADKEHLGSKKSVLNNLNEFIESKLIQEIDITSSSVGRPKKAYCKIKEDNIDLTLLNLAEFPPIVKEFIKKESETEEVLPTEVIIRLVSWAFNFLVSSQYADSKPISDLPEYLKLSSDPLTRLLDK